MDPGVSPVLSASSTGCSGTNALRHLSGLLTTLHTHSCAFLLLLWEECECLKSLKELGLSLRLNIKKLQTKK